MDPQAEGLEFLDWSSIPEQERYELQSILFSTPELQDEMLSPESQTVSHDGQLHEDIAVPPEEQSWEQHSPHHQDYIHGEMQHPAGVLPTQGPPVAMFAPMVPPPVSSAMPMPGGHPQPNVNAIYPLLVSGQPGMILGNVNLSVNANVQSYVTPISAGYHPTQSQYDFDKDKRRSGKSTKLKRDFSKVAEEQQQQPQPTQFQPPIMYPSPQFFVPHPPTAQHVSGSPLFITASSHPQPQMIYPHHPMYFSIPHMPTVPIPHEHAVPIPPEPAHVESMQPDGSIIIENIQHNEYIAPDMPPTQLMPSPAHAIIEEIPEKPIDEPENKFEFVSSTMKPMIETASMDLQQLKETLPVVTENAIVYEEDSDDDKPPDYPPPDIPRDEEPCVIATPNQQNIQQQHNSSPPPPVVVQPVPQVPPPIKSWASIVQSSNPAPCNQENLKPLARVGPFSSAVASQNDISVALPQQEQVVAPIPLARNKDQLPNHDHLDDPMLYRLGEYLCKYNLDHRSTALQPRGLTNRSNWCYVNATLQALLACPPFYNLMKNLPIRLPNYSKSGNRQQQSKSSTPIIDAVVEFMNMFTPLPPGCRPARKEKAAARRGEEVTVDVPQGPAFEPTCVYTMLGSIRSTAFTGVEGRQEDAEEFLSCLLNALNDEMLELMKIVDEPSNGLVNGQSETVTNGDANHPSEEEGDSEQWTVMRSKNRACLTRRADFGRTPVSDIFRGQLCSHVQRIGDQKSENVQPFYTLQLDIEKARSVSDALEQMVDRDRLEGVTCSKTQQQVEAWQQVTLEELPPVLLLHLKWFDYKHDGCSKIMKTMEYSVDLKIDNKLLSSSKSKYSPKQRTYKLFAVVYHNGNEASKGHYITDAYHSAMGVWVRYDDNHVNVVTEHNVTHPKQPAVPYILYYRRADTMGQPSLKATN